MSFRMRWMKTKKKKMQMIRTTKMPRSTPLVVTTPRYFAMTAMTTGWIKTMTTLNQGMLMKSVWLPTSSVLPPVLPSLNRSMTMRETSGLRDWSYLL